MRPMFMSGRATTPQALCTPAQGCGRSPLPWEPSGDNSQPQRGCVGLVPWGTYTTPLGLMVPRIATPG